MLTDLMYLFPMQHLLSALCIHSPLYLPSKLKLTCVLKLLSKETEEGTTVRGGNSAGKCQQVPKGEHEQN